VARGLLTLRSEDSSPRDLDTIKTNATELNETVPFAIKPRQKERLVNFYIKNMEAQLDAGESKINALEAEIDGPCADDYRRRIDNLKAKYAAARRKVDELKAAGNEKWELHKADIWIAWNELENAFQDFQQSALKKKEK
jgi:hypothetical protein